jgi:uncharacterized protein YgbK (DUF1537 family)
MTLRVAFYGDDFTGASDNCAQYYRHGLKTLLFFGDPGIVALQAAARTFDVIGVAGTARSLATRDMAAELMPLFQNLRALGAPIIQYKCCSTFDSSPEVGNLAHALGLMQDCWPGSFMPVLAATPEFGRYTLFGNHFARSGTRIFRLDRHPTMARHPVTPMHEADLTEILATQGRRFDRLVDVRELASHVDTPHLLAQALEHTAGAIFDGGDTQQVKTAAAAIWHIAQKRQVCALAAQGFAHGLGEHFEQMGVCAQAPTHRLAAVDRLLVLSGSCSAQSAAQIDWAEQANFLLLGLDPTMLGNPDGAALAALEADMLQGLIDGRSVIVYSARGPDDTNVATLRASVEAEQATPAALAERIGRLFARLARTAIERAGIQRMVVAGGDSSSFCMRHLGASAMAIEASHFAQNAHIGKLQSDDLKIDGVQVLLKGGQVGAPELYGLMRDGF